MHVIPPIYSTIITDFQKYYTTDRYPCTHTVYILELHYAAIHLHTLVARS
jgi:hypothetical protein